MQLAGARVISWKKWEDLSHAELSRNANTVKKVMQEIFPQNLFIYYY
jgi:hypothetical protein